MSNRKVTSHMSDRLLKAVYAMQACHALAEQNKLYKYTLYPIDCVIGKIPNGD
jgi:hypothetical protein